MESGTVDWAKVVMVMAKQEYWHWDVQVRVQVLGWLCDQCLTTDTIREVLDRSQAAKEVNRCCCFCYMMKALCLFLDNSGPRSSNSMLQC